ncbi:hypothetical protein IQ254_15590 [Nodosilinea sp. LEGE 07088]|uniref:hypothetical protein n=1 Tax=Nodosilinea sp. LEGE 07088 TaxID=2777968 RepID=UPI00187DE7C9|nr:hypothetical protein [Nodosilinea sp. LEGE 07088]MBE9138596.1 hypothetical protein [Nodosilinea sp. LEGE 07088]
MLTFATPDDEARAAQLMQPCLIRIVDNIRKHTEAIDWRSEYLEQVRWPGHATADQRQRVRDLAAQLEGATPEAAEALRQQLSQLPTPTPAYELRLTQGASDRQNEAPRTATLDVWELCFGVCFRNYKPHQPVSVDATLLDSDGEIDWITLDDKAKALVKQAIDRATAAG